MLQFSKQTNRALAILEAGGEILYYNRKNSSVARLYTSSGELVKDFNKRAFTQLNSAGLLKDKGAGFYGLQSRYEI